MFKIKSVFALFLISIVLLTPGCTSSNSDNNDNGDDTQVSRSTWEYFIPDLTSFSNIFEDDKFYIFIGNSIDKKDNYLVKVNKNGNNYSTKKFENTYILNFVKDINGNFIALNQKSESPTYLASLMYLSQNGEKLNEVVFENAKLNSKRAITTDENGVIFSYVNSEEKSIIVKVDFSGNILWEKEFGRELDPQLPENNELLTGDVDNISIDSDNNFVVFQNAKKIGPEGEVDYLDSGYSYYILNTQGELQYSNTLYKFSSIEFVNYFIFDVFILPDNSFLMENMWSDGLTNPKQLTYFDNFGDKIRDVYEEVTSTMSFCYDSGDNDIFMVIKPQAGNSLKLLNIDMEGNVLWQKEHNIEAYDSYFDSHLIKCNDGGYLFINNSSIKTNGSNNPGIYLLKIDKDFKTP